MNESQFQQLLEVARMRAMTPGEQASLREWLAKEPAARALWEEEQRVNGLVRGLSDVPVSSNFTAQVLAKVRRETAQPLPSRNNFAWWSRFLVSPRLAPVAVLVALVSLGVWQVRLHHRAQLAASVEALSGVAAVPTMEMLADFDAIVRLSRLPANSDAGVLTALQAP